MEITNSKMSALQMETRISASPELVWKGLTEKIGEWWPNEFYAGGKEGHRDVKIETMPGGRMVETWDEGGGTLWATVVSIQPGVQLQVHGHTFPNWGGPTEWYGTWDLEASGDDTILKFSEHALGKVSEAGTADRDKGWSFLWDVLKAHVEGNEAPQWVD